MKVNLKYQLTINGSNLNKTFALLYDLVNKNLNFDELNVIVK